MKYNFLMSKNLSPLIKCLTGITKWTNRAVIMNGILTYILGTRLFRMAISTNHVPKI